MRELVSWWEGVLLYIANQHRHKTGQRKAGEGWFEVEEEDESVP